MPSPKRRIAALVLWAGLVVAMVAPVLIAAGSPYLAYRNLPYIVGGFAGIVCLSLFVIQPLLAAGYLPGVPSPGSADGTAGSARRSSLCVLLHVGGLYLTSPRTRSMRCCWSRRRRSRSTACWRCGASSATAVLVALRRRSGLRYATWFFIHNALALVVVVATVIHALQIEGAMETLSKWLVCLAALATTLVVLLDLRVVKPLARWRRVTPEEPR